MSRAWEATLFEINSAVGRLEAQLDKSRAATGDNAGRTELTLESLHHVIVDRCAVAYRAGEFDASIFNAMKAVEQRLRSLIGGKPDDIGMALASKAFSGDSPKLLLSDIPAEQQALHQLFRGAIGALKNPHSHRFVDTTDPAKSLEVLAFASHLMRILDDARAV